MVVAIFTGNRGNNYFEYRCIRLSHSVEFYINIELVELIDLLPRNGMIISLFRGPDHIFCGLNTTGVPDDTLR